MYAAKAIVGALVAGLTTLATAFGDGHVSVVEGLGVAVAVLGTYSGVFVTTNNKQRPRD